jgi:hypothetical protein
MQPAGARRHGLLITYISFLLPTYKVLGARFKVLSLRRERSAPRRTPTAYGPTNDLLVKKLTHRSLVFSWTQHGKLATFPRQL